MGVETRYQKDTFVKTLPNQCGGWGMGGGGLIVP